MDRAVDVLVHQNPLRNAILFRILNASEQDFKKVVELWCIHCARVVLHRVKV